MLYHLPLAADAYLIFMQPQLLVQGVLGVGVEILEILVLALEGCLIVPTGWLSFVLLLVSYPDRPL